MTLSRHLTLTVQSNARAAALTPVEHVAVGEASFH